jgi:hypothetical protein
MAEYVKKILWDKMLEWDVPASGTQEEVLQIVPQGKTLHCVGPYANSSDVDGDNLHKVELYVNDKKTKSGYFNSKYYAHTVDPSEIILEGGDKLSLRITNGNTADRVHFEAWMRGYLGEK